MDNIQAKRNRLRYILIVITLVTLPCYCAGLIAVRAAGERTSTPTATETPTVTPSATETPSPTDSPTITLTITSTHTPTFTETASPTPTETSSPTVTETETSTPTATMTASPTATSTSTATNTPLPSPTETPTPPPPTENPTPTEDGVGSAISFKTVVHCLSDESINTSGGLSSSNSGKGFAHFVNTTIAQQAENLGIPYNVQFSPIWYKL
jgi:hypothetical protein